MKNIHVVPSPNPSRLYLDRGKLWIDNLVYGSNNQNICITSDEEITGFENNIWVYNNGRVWLWQNTMALRSDNKPKKIILTTDPKLIKDGVQTIEDDFLEWYVKNPSCEEVEVESFCKNGDDCPSQGAYDKQHLCNVGYEIIIPKEEQVVETTLEDFRVKPKDELKREFLNNTSKWNIEDFEEPKQLTDLEIAIKLEEIQREEPKQDFPMQKLIDIMEADEELRHKQETLEEVAERTVLNNADMRASYSMGEFGEEMFKRGARYQQEQDKNKYSEEEVLIILDKFLTSMIKGEKTGLIEDWFEKHKKK